MYLRKNVVGVDVLVGSSVVGRNVVGMNVLVGSSVVGRNVVGYHVVVGLKVGLAVGGGSVGDSVGELVGDGVAHSSLHVAGQKNLTLSPVPGCFFLHLLFVAFLATHESHVLFFWPLNRKRNEFVHGPLHFSLHVEGQKYSSFFPPLPGWFLLHLLAGFNATNVSQVLVLSPLYLKISESSHSPLHFSLHVFGQKYLSLFLDCFLLQFFGASNATNVSQVLVLSPL
jgi:hypothetical protein